MSALDDPAPGPGSLEEQLGCVRRDGCYAAPTCWRMGFCAFSRDETRREVQCLPDPKGPPRIVDKGAVKAKMRGEKMRGCRCGCGRPATDAHHILPRSLGGDDVEANIMGLWHDDHMLFEGGGTEIRNEMAALLGEKLTDEEMRYVAEKLAPSRGPTGGREWLVRYYKVSEERLDRALGQTGGS